MSLNLIETEFSESADEKPDWSIVTEDGIDGIARRAARKAAEEYGLALEYEDAYQEALVLLASRPSKARAAHYVGPGALFRWIGQRLRDEHLTEVKRRSNVKSWEVNQGQLEAQGY
ncbi:hypothetical protein OH733_05590 [Streptomyces griseus]|uniref:hypothetical protein n=1 Tax=Streptomyces griseus TaxID=1911 RepID=UPI0038658D3C|nr:hypothetical protein OH733_05590 [Streptomyces griseus]WTD71137.1 hypothetical protein OH763_31395 [Streptomyces griseus]